MNYPTIVYLEVALMENGECLHYGQSLGCVNEQQRKLVESGATKLTRGSVPMVALGDKIA